jgi:hypothetical protein
MKRRTIQILVGVLALGGLGFCLALTFRPFEAGPRYRGLPTSYWKNAVQSYVEQKPPTLVRRLETYLGLRDKNGMPSVLEDDPAAVPIRLNLIRAMAEVFVAAPKTNRFKLGEAISRLLPKCPETMRQDIGTGVLVAYDYSHPSYFLSRKEMITLFGPPDAICEGVTGYIIKRSDGILWYLSVDLNDDHVVGSTVCGIMDKEASLRQP